MADTNNNTSTNVSAGKPKVTGAIYVGATTATMPTATTTTLTGFSCVGYISEDGVTNSNSPESENIQAWGGDVVLTPTTSKEDKFTFTMIEAMNSVALGLVYGSSNVTVATDKTITIKANSSSGGNVAIVIDMVMTGNRAKRIVIPNCMVSEVGDITYADGEAVGYETTVSAMPDSSGNTHYEYIAAASTT